MLSLQSPIDEKTKKAGKKLVVDKKVTLRFQRYIDISQTHWGGSNLKKQFFWKVR